MNLRSKKIISHLALACALVVSGPAFAQTQSPRLSLETELIDNPILHADFSDPDAIRVGDDYYMTSSSFNCVPGLPILHSRDLVHWTLIGHAVERFPQEGYDAVQPGEGVWAPSLRYHNGEYYIYWGDPDRGIYMVKASSPTGPWQPPHLVKEGKGLIDTCPLWDEDGKAYLVHALAKSRIGYSSVIMVQEMTPDGRSLVGEPAMVVDGRDNPELRVVEGPKFYKHDGLYYIFAPAGGVTQGWQMVFRSKNVMGPYEMKRVLEQGSTKINGPHQGAWVEKPDGSNWFIHFQDKGAYGRVTHLQKMKWVDGWPAMGVDFDGNGVGEPAETLVIMNGTTLDSSLSLQTSDEFDRDRLGLQWQWMANPRAEWASLTERPGYLRLHATPRTEGAENINMIPNLVAQKWPFLEFTATAKVDATGLQPGDRFGFATTGMSAAYLEIQKTEQGLDLVRYDHNQSGREMDGNGSTEKVRVSLQTGQVFLRISITDFAQFDSSYSTDGEHFATIGEPYDIREGHWIGSKLGFYCLGGQQDKSTGHAEIDWIHVDEIDRQIRPGMN